MTKANARTTKPSTNYSNLGSTMLRRSWWQHWIYPLLFLLAMVLSLSTYLTLDSIQQSVREYVADNQKSIVGGDLILESKQAWSADVLEAVKAFEDSSSQENEGKDSSENKGVVYDYQFSAMMSNAPHVNNNVSSNVNNNVNNVDVNGDKEITQLARIKAVSASYPLYGEVKLASGKNLWQQLQPNHVVVETQVLTGLEVAVGDMVKIGDAVFTIADELLGEPDRPLTAFGFGARVLMTDTDLQATNLLGQRSRVNYRIELAGSPDVIVSEQATLEQLLESKSIADSVKLTNADEVDTSVTKVSDNVLMFLKLLVTAVLFLSAVALLSVVKAFVSLQQNANAIRRAIGESVSAIKRSYYRLFVSMAVVACVGSVGLGYVMLGFGANYLTAILPPDVELAIRFASVLKISVVALVITLLVVQHSLYAVTHTKPSAVLKQAMSKTQHPPWLWYALVLLASFGLMAWEFGSLLTGVQVLGGMMLLAGSFWLIGRGWLWLLDRLASRRGSSKGVKGAKGAKNGSKGTLMMGWMGRTAIHNMSRKGNQSGLFFVTLALSVAVLTMITLLNHSLNKQFVQAYPVDAPNLFLLDVQTEQHEELNTMIAEDITYYPVVRARVSEAGGVPIKEVVSRGSTGDDPTRIFNLSYGSEVMATEFIREAVQDGELYASVNGNSNNGKSNNVKSNGESNGANNNATGTAKTDEQSVKKVYPMSILDSASDLLNVDMGDTIRFNIQGIEIVGQITSVRERFERGPSPFFYFLFEPDVLADAPQIQFATTKVESGSIPQLQTDLARTFPAITTIDGGAIAKQVQGFVSQMSQLVQVFTLLALITGIMVLITSLLSTSQDRLRDSASFRLLGMQTSDLYKINMLEIGLLGLSAGLFAVIGASAVAYVVIVNWFNLPFSMPWGSFAIGAVLLVAVLLIIAVSYVRLVIGKGIMARVRGMV